MEDVLEVYQRPYDPLRPVVCIDETNKQLIKETRIPCEPGQPEKVDSVYVRNGVADVFMISEPLAGRRETVVTQTRTALDFAEILRYTSDTLYPRTEKIVLVTDNLNTHSPASLYKAFPPEEARRLAERFEWHYTPKHGSWLDMAEIEIGIMSRQALGKPLPDLESFKQQVRTWTIRRNAEYAKINWQFKTQDARIKLARLYPVIVYKLTGCSTSVLISAAIHGLIFIIMKIHNIHKPKTRKPFIPAPASSLGATPIKQIKEIHKKQNSLIIIFLILRNITSSSLQYLIHFMKSLVSFNILLKHSGVIFRYDATSFLFTFSISSG